MSITQLQSQYQMDQKDKIQVYNKLFIWITQRLEVCQEVTNAADVVV